MLNKFLAGKAAEGKEPKKKRPYLATECRDLNEADQWRQQILREIGKKVMEIQNAGLGEHRYLPPGNAAKTLQISQQIKPSYWRRAALSGVVKGP